MPSKYRRAVSDVRGIELIGPAVAEALGRLCDDRQYRRIELFVAVGSQS
jgi:hypothetical protein